VITRRRIIPVICSGVAAGACVCIGGTRTYGEVTLLSCSDYLPPQKNLELLDINAVRTTGEREIDGHVRQSVLNLYEFFTFRPAFYYVNGSFDQIAFAAFGEKFREFFGDVAGAVGMGLSLLHQSLNADRAGDDLQRIIAHEFSHIVQYNIRDPSGQLLYTVLQPEGATARRKELHADFMSGVFLSAQYVKTKREMPQLASLIRGDDHVSDDLHHGTTDERRTAFRQGFRIGLSLEKFSASEIFNVAWVATSIVK
jgi:hypothetical protein